MNKKNNKGFSLVELIVVVAIMAVLVGVLAPAYLRYVEKSRVQKDVSAVAEVVGAIEVAAADETIYKNIPATASAANVTITKGTGAISSTIAGLADEVKKTVEKAVMTSDALSASDIGIKVTKVDGNIKVEVVSPTPTGVDWTSINSR